LLPFPSRKISLGSDFPRKTEFPREIKKSFCDLAEGDVKKSQESIKVGYERKKVENRKKNFGRNFVETFQVSAHGPVF
jgi:hypothetical protein